MLAPEFNNHVTAPRAPIPAIAAPYFQRVDVILQNDIKLAEVLNLNCELSREFRTCAVNSFGHKPDLACLVSYYVIFTTIHLMLSRARQSARTAENFNFSDVFPLQIRRPFLLEENRIWVKLLVVNTILLFVLAVYVTWVGFLRKGEVAQILFLIPRYHHFLFFILCLTLSVQLFNHCMSYAAGYYSVYF